MTEAEINQAADALACAERSRKPIPPLTETFDEVGVPDGYAIQERNICRRVDLGARVVGHKIGLTAKAMQELFGVNKPDYGHLVDDMMVAAGGSIHLSAYIAPYIEVEPAFILRDSLRGPGVTVEDVLQATERVVPSFELIDSRIIDWKIQLADTVADNGSSAAVVLGEHRATSMPDLSDELTELWIDGEIVESGSTSAVLGHPAAGIAWLANTLASYGAQLEAQHVVLPGTCIRAVRVHAGQHVVGRFPTLGEVDINFI